MPLPALPFLRLPTRFPRFVAALLSAPLLLAPAIPVGAAGLTIPPPAAETAAPAEAALQSVVLAGGCFWGVQAVFQHTKGVRQAESGYAGGTQASAKYELVSLGNTGHAEAVQVTFDPREISFGTILQIYFSVAHDPTELNRQGPDVGTQYRSEIFYQNAEQQQAAQAYVAQLNAAKVFKRPIVTRIEPLNGFYAAEAYHQDYATLHPYQPYIMFNDLPKVEALKRMFTDVYREVPVTVSAAKTN
jgi:peptide-methionine (S)-S-oxide reductase